MSTGYGLTQRSKPYPSSSFLTGTRELEIQPAPQIDYAGSVAILTVVAEMNS